MATRLRIATFNLENLDTPSSRNEPTVERRAELMRPQLIRLEADVLCLQEIHSQEEGAVVIIAVCSFVFAFVSGISNDPPLPAVSLGQDQTIQGTLLTHTDGYWYVLIHEGDVVAIPDDSAGKVRVYQHPEQP